MPTSDLDGPFYAYGDMSAMPLAGFTPQTVPDPNSDASPSLFFQGVGLPDVRFWYPKDQVVGRTGVIPAHLFTMYFRSIAQIPCALSASNIAAAQNVTNGTAMTLATDSLGITNGVPVRPLTNNFGVMASGTPVNVMALDFGFGFGTTVAGSTTVTVNSSTRFSPGMPIIIGGAGNSAGTIALLTNVVTLASATTITIATAALAAQSAAPIGTGDIWPNPMISTPTPPQAAFPFLGRGPAVFLDPRQTVARGVRITGVASGVGGIFTVVGYDVYGAPMSEAITVAAGVATGWGLKAFKYITSVTPNVTDAHNYAVGTSDVFGFAYRSVLWEEVDVSWAGTAMTTNTGWVAGVGSTATTTTGDVRGTIQISTNGGGTGITASPSNGSVTSLQMTGRRMKMNSAPSVVQMTQSTQANPTDVYGVVQA